MKVQENPLEELSQLTGGLAHEIRNPLSTLRVNLKLLAEDLRELDVESDTVRRSLLRIDAMHNEVRRLSNILDDFVRFVAMHQLALAAHDLNKVVAQLIEFFEPQAANAKVRIMTHFCSDPLECRLDVNLVKQAFLNLFLNAQQAMPNGGDLMVRTCRAGNQARVDISDTGIGIDEANLGRIFDAYFSTKKGGVGLGLAMSRRIIREHGGDIRVESQPGKGSNFSITLPLYEPSSGEVRS
jgi:signal transduction histidine kinase